MTYVSWATFHEGASDGFYFEVLLPRIIQEIITRDGTRNSEVPNVPALKLGLRGRDVEGVAQEICDAKDALHIVFVHADTGGRNLEKGLDERSIQYCRACHALCAFPVERCVIITPRHETEAWVLADGQAIASAFGYTGRIEDVGLPTSAIEAERLGDPKATLNAAIQIMTGRRRKGSIEQTFSAIAQRQSIEALRRSNSFREFEVNLRAALTSLGCI